MYCAWNKFFTLIFLCSKFPRGRTLGDVDDVGSVPGDVRGRCTEAPPEV